MSDSAVMTVLGPRSADYPGIVDAHDHLFLDTPALPGFAFVDLEGSVTEVSAAHRGGLGTIVDMTPIGCGRDPAKMRAIATEVEVIAAAGFQDLGRSDYFRSRGGGPGMNYLPEVFMPRLRRRIGDAATDTILTDGPARAFTMAAVRDAVA